MEQMQGRVGMELRERLEQVFLKKATPVSLEARMARMSLGELLYHALVTMEPQIAAR